MTILEKMFAYSFLFAIILILLLAIYGYIAQSEREIAREEAEMEHKLEMEKLRDAANRPVISIKVIGGDDFTVQKKAHLPEERSAKSEQIQSDNRYKLR